MGGYEVTRHNFQVLPYKHRAGEFRSDCEESEESKESRDWALSVLRKGVQNKRRLATRMFESVQSNYERYPRTFVSDTDILDKQSVVSVARFGQLTYSKAAVVE